MLESRPIEGRVGSNDWGKIGSASLIMDDVSGAFLRYTRLGFLVFFKEPLSGRCFVSLMRTMVAVCSLSSGSASEMGYFDWMFRIRLLSLRHFLIRAGIYPKYQGGLFGVWLEQSSFPVSRLRRDVRGQSVHYQDCSGMPQSICGLSLDIVSRISLKITCQPAMNSS